MINDILKLIKQGIQEKDNKLIQDNVKILNKNGMDNYTIQVLLKELWAEL